VWQLCDLAHTLAKKISGGTRRQGITQAIAELKAEARAVGLSDADIDAELVAYNAERRDRSSG
jgi:hypothetical protein